MRKEDTIERRVWLAVALLTVLVGFAFSLTFEMILELGKPNGGAKGSYSLGIMVASIGIALVARWVTNLQGIQLEERIQEAASECIKQPEKARPAWEVARLTLEAHFNSNLSQIRWIFWLSIAVMGAGFGTLVWSVQQASVAMNSGASNDIAKALPAILTATGGIITEFIGATFLFVYRSTLQQAVVHCRTLERLTSVGIALQILDGIDDNAREESLKCRTKAKLVETLVMAAQDSGGKETSPARKCD